MSSVKCAKLSPLGIYSVGLSKEFLKDSPRCMAMENGGCKRNAQFVLRYKIKGIIHHDTFCNEHAINRVAWYNEMKLKVAVYKLTIEADTFILS